MNKETSVQMFLAGVRCRLSWAPASGGYTDLPEATEEHLQQADFVRASRLTAAEAMLEDARKLEAALEDVLNKAYDGEVYRSEWIDGVDLKFISSRLFDYRVARARFRPPKQASKKDSVKCSKCSTQLQWEPDSQSVAIRCLDCRDLFCVNCARAHFPTDSEFRAKLTDAGHEKELLETQLAEARAELKAERGIRETEVALLKGQRDEAQAAQENFRILLADARELIAKHLASTTAWDDERHELRRKLNTAINDCAFAVNGREELKAKLEAAEAESARYRELLSRVFMWRRDAELPSGVVADIEVALNGPSDPSQPSQPERLGGPVEAFRSELILALESVEAEFSVRKALADVAAALKSASRRSKRS